MELHLDGQVVLLHLSSIEHGFQQVSYDLVKRFVPVPELSAVKEDLLITIPNIPYWAGADRMAGQVLSSISSPSPLSCLVVSCLVLCLLSCAFYIVSCFFLFLVPCVLSVVSCGLCLVSCVVCHMSCVVYCVCLMLCLWSWVLLVLVLSHFISCLLYHATHCIFHHRTM